MTRYQRSASAIRFDELWAVVRSACHDYGRELALDEAAARQYRCSRACCDLAGAPVPVCAGAEAELVRRRFPSKVPPAKI
jgi:hypothetical protein